MLSGGGARGGAHIGVLKALEELRVPVDYMAGTSIGAVIGGFYVSGMSVADLEQLVESLEWETAFLNVTPRELKSFRRKRDDDSFLVNQKPGLNDGEFELPFGLVQGQVIDMIISRETLRASQVDNFDQLAIPFRAVAGDIVTGEAVVLSSGSLARAIRASMSIPAALSPIEIDGRLLVDGGIVLNLPVEVAREMGADVVIAVDISSELLARETLRSVLDITSQLTNMLTRNGTLQQRAKLTSSDVLLVPTFGGDLTSMDFARMRETIQTGYDTVMQNRAQFERLALTEVEYDAFVAARRDPRMSELPIVEFVRLDNSGPVADSVVEARLGAIKLGEPLDVDAVERAMNTVYGLDYYQNVRYGLVNDSDGTGIELAARRALVGAELPAARNGVQLRGRLRLVVRARRELPEHGDQPARRRVARHGRHRRRARARRGPVSAVRRRRGSTSTRRRCISSRLSSTSTRATSASRKRSCARRTLEFAVGRELLT